MITIEGKLINYMEKEGCLLYLDVMTVVSTTWQRSPQDTEMSLERWVPALSLRMQMVLALHTLVLICNP